MDFRRKILLNSLKTGDLVIMVASFLLTAFILNAEMGTVTFEQLLSMRIKFQNILIMFAFVAGWYWMFSAFGLYNSKRFSTRYTEKTS
jgi:hypothetical protein